MSLYGFGQTKPLQQGRRDSLVIKFDSLKAAVVTATLRPRMQGDTLEYNVAHVQLPSNAVIEELLRRLPGLRVDADGTITYNGEKIQHLLVDGEDVFGEDPTLITRSFDASKISRIQVLDRRSDKSVFTGVDDGTRIKTLNLVLKDEAKNGYFGRGEISGGGQGYYTGAAVLAGFRDKEQLTALGLSGNTGVLGFNGGAGSSSSSIAFFHSVPDPLGASAGPGVPRFHAAAIHYANQWDGMEDHLVANYQYGNSWSHPLATSKTLQTIADSLFSQRQTSQSVNKHDQHAIRVQYNWAPSSRVALQLRFQEFLYHYQNEFSATANSAFNDAPVNNSLRSITDETNRHFTDAEAAWRVQLGRQSGRVLSLTTGFSDVEYVTNGYLFSVNRYFLPGGGPAGVDTVDQRKRLGDHNSTFSGGISFTQPLYPGATLGISYNGSVMNDVPLQHTYDRTGGKYNALIDSLTNDIVMQTTTNTGRINIQGKDRHLSYTIGLTLTDYKYHQRISGADSIFRLNYRNLAPKLFLRYTANPKMNVFFTYAPATELPSADLLTSIRTNNDPLHLTLGNASLKPVTTQFFGVGFGWLRAWMIGTGLNLSFSSHSIGTRTTTDSLGRQISQPVNLGGTSSGGLYFNVNHTMVGVDWGVNIDERLAHTESFVGSTIDKIDNFSSNWGISATKFVANKYSLQIVTKFSYLYIQNSINSSTPLHYWTQSHSATGAVYLIPHYGIGTSATYNWQQAAGGIGNSTSVLLWNGYVSRNFLQNKLVVKALINNILDQNSGITRTNSGNVTTETATNILGRCWMLSVVYHFDKKFKKK